MPRVPIPLSCLVVLVTWSVFGATTDGKFVENFGLGDYPFRNVSLPWEDRVKDLVGRLTLEEIRDQMSRGGAGNNGGPVPAITRLGIGAYQFDTECLRGDVGAPGKSASAFPQALGLGAAFSTDLIYRVAEATGIEVRGKHNDFVKAGQYGDHTGASCFSPVINIMRDSRWGRNQETYGEDPFLTGQYAASFIQGLQGNDTRYVRASGGCKHFDVHGGPESIPVSRFSFNAEVSEDDWRTTFLPAFRSCVKAGTYNLMCSYNRINGIPSCANKELLTDIARGEWGFQGYVISDEGAIENIIYAHHYLNNPVDTVAACVNAGCNLELSGNLKTPVFYSLLDAINQGKLTEDTVREAVGPLFYTRMRLGEFDPPAMNPYSALSNDDVETPQHKALAIEAAMKSFVLLKNTNSFLPLKSTKYNSIGMIGPFADHVEMGDYSPNPDRSDVKTPLETLTSIAGNVKYTDGCVDGPTCRNYNPDNVANAVTGNDINFVLLGTGTQNEAEGRDRPDTELPGMQRQLLIDVITKSPAGTPIVLLLFNAGPVNISFADQSDRVVAIMECFFPAQATGDALLHVLLNDVTGAVPAGRLPYTWPMYASQLPPMVNYSMQGRTYRYFEGDPLYPFGYGLSYTSFFYDMIEYSSIITAGDPMNGEVHFSRTDTTDAVADEVVQIYIQWMNATVPPPSPSVPKIQLAWFQRVTVPNGGMTLNFRIEPQSMAVWVKGQGWVIKPGVIRFYVGGQQPNQARSAPSNVMWGEFTVQGTKVLGKY